MQNPTEQMRSIINSMNAKTKLTESEDPSWAYDEGLEAGKADAKKAKSNNNYTPEGADSHKDGFSAAEFKHFKRGYNKAIKDAK